MHFDYFHGRPMGCDLRSERRILCMAKRIPRSRVLSPAEFLKRNQLLLSETRQLRGYGEGCPRRRSSLHVDLSTAATRFQDWSFRTPGIPSRPLSKLLDPWRIGGRSSFQMKLHSIKVGDACCTQKFLRSIRCGESQDIHTAAPGGKYACRSILNHEAAGRRDAQLMGRS